LYFMPISDALRRIIDPSTGNTNKFQSTLQNREFHRYCVCIAVESLSLSVSPCLLVERYVKHSFWMVIFLNKARAVARRHDPQLSRPLFCQFAASWGISEIHARESNVELGACVSDVLAVAYGIGSLGPGRSLGALC
jgi:hypothetical protein